MKDVITVSIPMLIQGVKVKSAGLSVVACKHNIQSGPLLLGLNSSRIALKAPVTGHDLLKCLQIFIVKK